MPQGFGRLSTACHSRRGSDDRSRTLVARLQTGLAINCITAPRAQMLEVRIPRKPRRAANFAPGSTFLPLSSRFPFYASSVRTSAREVLCALLVTVGARSAVAQEGLWEHCCDARWWPSGLHNGRLGLRLRVRNGGTTVGSGSGFGFETVAQRSARAPASDRNGDTTIDPGSGFGPKR